MAKLFLLAVSFFVVLIGTVELYSDSASSAWPAMVFFTFLVWIVTYLFTTTLHFRTPYLLVTTYVGPLAAFHLSWVMLDVLGGIPVLGFRTGATGETYRQAGWYTVLAFGALGIGLSAAMFKSPNNPRMSSTDMATLLARTKDWLFWMGIGLLLASAIFFLMFVAVAGNPLNYSRADFFETSAGGRGLGAFLMVFPGAVVTLLVGARKLYQRWFAWGLAGVAFSLILLSGYRSQAMYPLLVAVVLFAKLGRRIPISLAVAGLAFLLIAIPIIGQVRQLTYDSIDLKAIENSARESRVTDGLINLGGTLGVFRTALQVVPDKVPYQHGYTYWVAIKDALPNISESMRKSERQEALNNFVRGSAAIFDLPPGDWMTYIISPEKFRVGHGVGFSAIAEPYVNFGYIGVLIYFVLLGGCFGLLERLSLTMHPWILLITSTTFWALLRTVRNSAGNFVKPLAFVFVVLGIWWLINRMLSVNVKIPRLQLRGTPSARGLHLGGKR